MPIQKRRPPKGMPPSVLHIWKRGERVRFNGGWLGEKAEDRAIAEWIDANPREAWGKVKMLIYLYITGRVGVAGNESGEYRKADDLTLGEAAKALGDFDV